MPCGVFFFIAVNNTTLQNILIKISSKKNLNLIAKSILIFYFRFPQYILSLKTGNDSPSPIL